MHRAIVLSQEPPRNRTSYFLPSTVIEQDELESWRDLPASSSPSSPTFGEAEVRLLDLTGPDPNGVGVAGPSGV
jgi:hypothetical protein